VAAVFRDQLSLLHAVRRRGLRGLHEARERRRLSRAVRTRAHEEREHCHRGGVIEFASVARRTALYEGIADRLEELDRPISALGIGQLERLLAEPPPYRDYGAVAKERNARIELVLRALEGDRGDAIPDESHAACIDGRAGAAEIDRSQKVER
jgi:hypothetical protein